MAARRPASRRRRQCCLQTLCRRTRHLRWLLLLLRCLLPMRPWQWRWRRCLTVTRRRRGPPERALLRLRDDDDRRAVCTRLRQCNTRTHVLPARASAAHALCSPADCITHNGTVGEHCLTSVGQPRRRAGASRAASEGRSAPPRSPRQPCTPLLHAFEASTLVALGPPSRIRVQTSRDITPATPARPAPPPRRACARTASRAAGRCRSGGTSSRLAPL